MPLRPCNPHRGLELARTHMGTLIEITHLVSDLNEVQVFDVSSQKVFGER